MNNIRPIEPELADLIRSSWSVLGDTLVWKRNSKNGRFSIGDPVATTSRPSGHRNVYLYFNGRLRGFVEARIIWFLRTGEYPELCVEHKDGNPLNNSVENLRLATHSQNMANTRFGRTGRRKKGVYFDKRVGRFYVQVQKDGKKHSIWGFTDFDTAYEARQSLAVKLFGEFAR